MWDVGFIALLSTICSPPWPQWGLECTCGLFCVDTRTTINHCYCKKCEKILLYFVSFVLDLWGGNNARYISSSFVHMFCTNWWLNISNLPSLNLILIGPSVQISTPCHTSRWWRWSQRMRRKSRALSSLLSEYKPPLTKHAQWSTLNLDTATQTQWRNTSPLHLQVLYLKVHYVTFNIR